MLARYERVTFDKELTRPEGKPKADLLAPGHPLLDAVTDLIIERYGTLLKQGTMLADRHDPGTEPRLLVAVTHEITDGHDPARTITKKFGFAEMDAQGPLGVRSAGEARYLDYEPMNDPERAVASPLRDAPWLSAGVETVALDWAVTEGMPEELARTRDLVTARVAQVRRLVKQRLTGEINYWDMRHADLLDAAVRGPVPEDETGDRLRPRPRPGTPPGEAPRGPGPRRGTDRPPAGHLRGRAGRPAGTARQAARRPGPAACSPAATRPRPTAAPSPPSWPPNAASAATPARCRITIRATTSTPARPDGHLIFIEVKGRIEGAEEFWVTRTEALHGKNSAAGSRLAMVSVHPAGPEFDQVRYIVDPFRDVDFGDFAATGVIGNWPKEWERGVDPV